MRAGVSAPREHRYDLPQHLKQLAVAVNLPGTMEFRASVLPRRGVIACEARGPRDRNAPDDGTQSTRNGAPSRSSAESSRQRKALIPGFAPGIRAFIAISGTPTGSPIRENAVFWSPVRIGQAQANHRFLAIENEPFSRCRTLPSPAPHWLHTKFAQRHGVKG